VNRGGAVRRQYLRRCSSSRRRDRCRWKRSSSRRQSSERQGILRTCVLAGPKKGWAGPTICTRGAFPCQIC
jgi:hypothetical protein